MGIIHRELKLIGTPAVTAKRQSILIDCQYTTGHLSSCNIGVSKAQGLIHIFVFKFAISKIFHQTEKLNVTFMFKIGSC